MSMQKRILERLDREVCRCVDKSTGKLTLWTSFDSSVAPNVGVFSVGRESDVGPSRRVRVDFQTGHASFKTIDGRPELPGRTGGTSYLSIDYDKPTDQQNAAMFALVAWLTEGLV